MGYVPLSLCLCLCGHTLHANLPGFRYCASFQLEWRNAQLVLIILVEALFFDAATRHLDSFGMFLMSTVLNSLPMVEITVILKGCKLACSNVSAFSHTMHPLLYVYTCENSMLT